MRGSVAHALRRRRSASARRLRRAGPRVRAEPPALHPCLPASASCDGFDVVRCGDDGQTTRKVADVRRRQGHRVPPGRLQEPLRRGGARALQRRLRVLGGRPRQRGASQRQRGGAAVRGRRVERRSPTSSRGHGRRGRRRAAARRSSSARSRRRASAPRSLEVFKLGPREVDGSAPGKFNTGTHTALSRDAYRVARRADRRLPVQPARERQRVLERRVAACSPTRRARRRRRQLVPRRGLAADHRAPATIPTQNFGTGPARVPHHRRHRGQTRRCTSSRRRAIVGGGPIPAAARRTATFDVELQPFDVLNLETGDFNADFTGTLHRRDGPVAVFAGSEASRRAVLRRRSRAARCCADHLEEQAIPLRAAGKRFVARPRAEPHAGARRGGRRDRPRSTSRSSFASSRRRPGSTKVTTSLPAPTTLDSTARARTSRIVARPGLRARRRSQPVLVADVQVEPGGGRHPRAGCPAATRASCSSPPVEQWRNDYVFSRRTSTRSTSSCSRRRSARRCSSTGS